MACHHPAHQRLLSFPPQLELCCALSGVTRLGLQFSPAPGHPPDLSVRGRAISQGPRWNHPCWPGMLPKLRNCLELSNPLLPSWVLFPQGLETLGEDRCLGNQTQKRAGCLPAELGWPQQTGCPLSMELLQQELTPQRLLLKPLEEVWLKTVDHRARVQQGSCRRRPQKLQYVPTTARSAPPGKRWSCGPGRCGQGVYVCLESTRNTPGYWLRLMAMCGFQGSWPGDPDHVPGARSTAADFQCHLPAAGK